MRDAILSQEMMVVSGQEAASVIKFLVFGT